MPRILISMVVLGSAIGLTLVELIEWISPMYWEQPMAPAFAIMVSLMSAGIGLIVGIVWDVWHHNRKK